MLQPSFRFAALVAVMGALTAPPASLASGGFPRGDGGGGGPDQGAGPAHAAALTPQEEADLQYVREVEKVARDVYFALYQRWGLPIFSKISESEQRHTDAARVLIEKYDVADPAALTPPGLFVNGELQQLHDSLVKAGFASATAALDVGVLLEETDIADLQRAMANTSRPDVLEVYGVLLYGSNRHLAAFTDWSR